MIDFSKLSECKYDAFKVDDNGYYTLDTESAKTTLDTFKKCRPEAAVYEFTHKDFWLSRRKEIYETLLAGCALLRAQKYAEETGRAYDEGKCIIKIADVLRWLGDTNFYTAPGSTVYHDSYAGGLCDHSIRVATHAVKLYYSDVMPAVRRDCTLADVVLTALIHDWCKIDLYEPYMKNVKNDLTGQWEQVEAFKKREDFVAPFGHGASSLYLTMKFFKLSQEEALAIRWHMGEYNVANNEMNELHYANENYPLVFLLQFADRLSITNYQV